MAHIKKGKERKDFNKITGYIGEDALPIRSRINMQDAFAHMKLEKRVSIFISMAARGKGGPLLVRSLSTMFDMMLMIRGKAETKTRGNQ